ncbi:hypothetical protein AB0C81_01900 [Streptomyces roseoverticillatus]|uniref:hypothetical protein n=1 Tax=Streptomyces roseoverticillatus TaxID=66429 RepID=UPI0033E43E2F
MAAAALLLTATGCVTVHGEREIIPSVDKAEATKVLKTFTDGYNEGYRKLDPGVIARVETGALAEIGRSDLAAQSAQTPGGNPGYPALVLDDARFTVPKQAGWPKFFLADTRSNRDGNRWLVVFTRYGVKDPWKAAYLSIVNPGKVPEFVTDKDGHAEAVPAAKGKDHGLMTDPGKVSAAYTGFLRTGEGRSFAPGPRTTGLREERDKVRRTTTFWTEFIDTPEQAPAFPAPALRIKGGGALVFFTAHHREKRTMAEGLRPAVTDPRTKALLKGDLKRSVTYTRVSEAAVEVPPRDADGGMINFLNRIDTMTAAQGE